MSAFKSQLFSSRAVDIFYFFAEWPGQETPQTQIN